MDVDPRTNVVVFQLNDGSEEVVVGRAPTLAEDGVRQAWEGVRHEYSAHSASVVALHSEWEPSPRDVAYIETTFPDAAVTFNFPRPTPDGWEEAFAAAQATMLEVAAATDGHPHPTATDPQAADSANGGLSGPANPASGGLSEPADPATGGPSEPASPATDGLSDPADPAIGGLSGPTNPANGGSFEPANLATGGPSEPASPATDGPSDPANPAIGGPAGPADPATGGPSEPADPATGGPAEPADSATGGLSGPVGNGQEESAGRGELLPVLWSQSSPRAEMLEAVPHWPVASGRLHLALAVVAPTPRGTIGMYHVTHHQLGDHPFNELMAEACENLASGLRVNSHENDEGQLLSLSGTLVSAMVCLPDFYHRLSKLANAERLVVGLPCPDEVYVAAADSPMAAVIHQAVHQSEYPTTELVPSVLSIVGDEIEVLSERD